MSITVILDIMIFEFEKHAHNRGEAGDKWLKSIPQIIASCEKKWNIQVQQPFDLSWNYVAPVIRVDGSSAVLKVGFPEDKEFQSETDALEVYDGDAAAKLYEKDIEMTAILIERVNPGLPLSLEEDDDKATRILAKMMKLLWKPLPESYTFPTVADWVKGIQRFKVQISEESSIPWYYIDKADEYFRELIETSSQPMLLHGDLHHDNVLSSHRSGWLVIDPKGVAAEPAYETAAMIRNPQKQMKNSPSLKNKLERRIRVMADELQFDSERIYKWCYAQTVLSAIWSFEDRENVKKTVQIAEILDRMSIV